MRTEDIETAHETVNQMGKNHSLVLLSYSYNSANPHHKGWLLNDSGSTTTGSIPAKVGRYLETAGLVCAHPNWKDTDRRSYFQLSKKGWQLYSNLATNRTPLVETPATPASFEPASPEEPKTQPPPKEIDPPHENQFLEILSHSTQEQIGTILFYGIESLKDDIPKKIREKAEKEIANQQDKLSEAQNSLLALFPVEMGQIGPQ